MLTDNLVMTNDLSPLVCHLLLTGFKFKFQLTDTAARNAIFGLQKCKFVLYSVESC